MKFPEQQISNLKRNQEVIERSQWKLRKKIMKLLVEFVQKKQVFLQNPVYIYTNHVQSRQVEVKYIGLHEGILQINDLSLVNFEEKYLIKVLEELKFTYYPYPFQS